DVRRRQDRALWARWPHGARGGRARTLRLQRHVRRAGAAAALLHLHRRRGRGAYGATRSTEWWIVRHRRAGRARTVRAALRGLSFRTFAGGTHERFFEPADDAGLLRADPL